MRSYESIVVLDGALNKEDMAGEIKKIQSVLEKRGAQGVVHSDWGRRTVAYPVQKKSLGHYQHFEFSTDKTDLVEAATSELLLSESVLKMQTHRLSTKKRKFKGNPKAVGVIEEDDEY